MSKPPAYKLSVVGGRMICLFTYLFICAVTHVTLNWGMIN